MISHTHTCRICLETKPLLRAFWKLRRGGFYLSRCRQCINEADAENNRLRKNRPTPLSHGHRMKLCESCGNMPHRVPGIRCPDCGLECGRDTPIPVVLWRSQWGSLFGVAE